MDISEPAKITQKIETNITNDRVDLSFEIVVESKNANSHKTIMKDYLEKLNSVLEEKYCDLKNNKFISYKTTTGENKSTTKISIEDVNNTCTNKGQKATFPEWPELSPLTAPVELQPTSL